MIPPGELNDAAESGFGELRSQVADLHGRVGNLEQGFEKFKNELTENTSSTRRIEDSVAFIVEFLDAAKGGFKLLQWMGKIAKPAGYVIGLVITVWVGVKTGMSIK